MKILHYSLGFPPYRTGGLTKFCMDLMKEQIRVGHTVGLLWPGEIKLFDHRVSIRKGSLVDGISNFEIINPLPVSYDEGIKEFDVFMQEGDKQTYDRFLTAIKPDVVHVHTLMGLHKSFLIAAREKGIRLIFSTHDFFPICPKITIFRHGQICNTVNTCEECGICNNSALSLKKIQILQSKVYRRFKDSNLVKQLRKQHRDDYLSDSSNDNSMVGSDRDYLRLRNNYFSMLRLMDVIHCNSYVSKDVYEKFFDGLNYKVISITHANIADHRKRRLYNSDHLRIRYLGTQSAAKGYYALKDALDQLSIVRKDFVLDVHFTPDDVPQYMRCHGRYDYEELESIFDNTDLLVCPSIWYETFGFTVLEALSYGVPVIVSDHVGAKDILEDGCGICYEVDEKDGLFRALLDLCNTRLNEINLNICSTQNIKDLLIMSNEIEDLYNTHTGEVK